MNNHIEKRIARLLAGQFGPKDPRTPSIASAPGIPLSLENEAKILESQQRNRDYLQRERERHDAELHKYWSDERHLADKLQSTIQSIAAHRHEPSKHVARDLAIVKGTGAIVTQQNGKFHYVEFIAGEDNPVYISPEATLPEAQIPSVVSAAALGIV